MGTSRQTSRIWLGKFRAQFAPSSTACPCQDLEHSLQLCNSAPQSFLLRGAVSACERLRLWDSQNSSRHFCLPRVTFFSTGFSLVLYSSSDRSLCLSATQGITHHFSSAKTSATALPHAIQRLVGNASLFYPTQNLNNSSQITALKYC